MQLLQLKHTLHPIAAATSWHLEVPLKKNLTESLGPMMPDIVDEARLSIEATIGRSAGTRNDYVTH